MMHQPVDGDPKPMHSIRRCAPALHRIALDCNVNLSSLWLNPLPDPEAQHHAISVTHQWSCVHHTQTTTQQLPGCFRN
jgi:hypothetical protein